MSFLVSLLGKKLINFYVKQPAMVRSEMFITAISFMGTKRDDANTDVVKQSKLLHQIDRAFYPHVSSLLDFNFTKPEIISVSDKLSLRHISGKRTNKNSSKKIAILYIHGGAFVMNMNTLYDPYLNFLNLLTTLPVYGVDYRTAPEHRFPAAIDDVISSYNYLIEKEGYDPSNIVFMGDSAGGNLVVTSMLSLLEKGLLLPGGGICLSPFLDLTFVTQQFRDLFEETTTIDEKFVVMNRWDRETDYLPIFLAPHYIEAYTGLHSSDIDLRNPLISPVYSKNLHLLPPLLISAGAGEYLLPQSIELIKNANTNGKASNILLHVTPSEHHDFQLFAPWGLSTTSSFNKKILSWLSALYPDESNFSDKKNFEKLLFSYANPPGSNFAEKFAWDPIDLECDENDRDFLVKLT